MTNQTPDGISGYDHDPRTYVEMSNALVFENVHESVLHLIPSPPARVLDIGTCSGRDAAALARRGHAAVAVEPVPAFLEQAKRLHPALDIRWVYDSLPDLRCFRGGSDNFDFIVIHAVWMHLNQAERKRAMTRIAQLMRPDAILTLTLRHGPVPENKIMYAVDSDETIRLAKDNGLRVALHLENQKSALRRTDVTWTRLAFRKADSDHP